MADSWIRNLRDAGDILKRARSPVELAKALVPNQWLARKVLNDEAPAASSASPTEIAQALRKLRNQLKTEALDEDGQVDYAKLRSSPTFAEMKRTSGLLQAIDPGEMTDDATRTAFWINLYNVLAIHGVLALGIRASGSTTTTHGSRCVRPTSIRGFMPRWCAHRRAVHRWLSTRPQS
ncbi:MAG: DUF547 domain-containing protein [Deltaproteobacteria bacterium]|nr:DUF547 domain-containing protein [Deltaproteobacteria bacterium]